jgi:hypothetical protein
MYSKTFHFFFLCLRNKTSSNNCASDIVQNYEQLNFSINILCTLYACYIAPVFWGMKKGKQILFQLLKNFQTLRSNAGETGLNPF